MDSGQRRGVRLVTTIQALFYRTRDWTRDWTRDLG